jgi:hypothetical protein
MQLTNHAILSNSGTIQIRSGPPPQHVQARPRPRTQQPIPPTRDIREFLVPTGNAPNPAQPPLFTTPNNTRPISQPPSPISLPTHNTFSGLQIEDLPSNGVDQGYTFPQASITGRPLQFTNSIQIPPFTAPSSSAAIQYIANTLNSDSQDVPGDGNCLIHAITHGLKTQTHSYNSLTHSPAHLRLQIYNYLNSPEGQHIITNLDLSPQELQRILQHPGLRPTDLEIESIIALADILHITIRFVEIDFNNNTQMWHVHTAQYTPNNTNHTFSILQHHGHYQYLRPREPD